MSRKNEFREMLPIIFTLAWPTMLEQLMQTAVQYIDTAMVGSLGTQATAAVGATGTVNWMIYSVVSSLSVGFLAYISQAFGAKEEARARKAGGQSVLLVLFFGVLLTGVILLFGMRVPVWMRVDESIREMAGRYFLILNLPMIFRSASIVFGTDLRAVGDTKTPMRIGIAMNVINVALNFLLIYPTRTMTIGSLSIPVIGAGWGIDGAAIASAISYVYGGIVITIKAWKHPAISPKGQSLKPDPAILKPCFKVAIPNLLQRMATTFGFVVFASMINTLGAVSTAAHTVANTVESAFYIPGWGMQTAAATLAGNAYGARDDRRLSGLARCIMPLEIGLMIISGGLLFIFAPQLVQIFAHDPEVISLGATVLRMVAVSEPFYGVPIVFEGIMMGIGKTTTPFVFNVTGTWGVRIVGTYICTQIMGLGLVSAWGCMIAHNMVLFILFTVNYLTGRWKPKDMRPRKTG